MTRRFCACGVTRWTRMAFETHLDPGRPGCREITEAQFVARHGDPDTHRAAS